MAFKDWLRRRSAPAAAPAAPAQTPVAARPAGSSSRVLAIIALQAVLIIGLTWALVYFARDEYNAIVEREEEEIETPSRVSTQEGAALIKLSVQEQRANGIETRPLQARSAGSSAQAFGTVVDLAPLFDARAKHQAVLDEARVVRAQLARSEAEYRRADALFKDDRSVSERVLQDAQAAWRSDQARLAASNRAAAQLAAGMRQQWGELLGERATQAASDLLSKVARGEEVLVQVALPAQQAPVQLDVAPLGSESDWASAKLIGPAPRADAQFAGQTFFYRAPAHALRVGMQIAARHEAGQRAQGVSVPREALIWHGGKSWAYLKQGVDAFLRREVVTGQPLDDGWFVQQGFKGGEEVVVRGAQLLLSEEFRYQIRNENDD